LTSKDSADLLARLQCCPAVETFFAKHFIEAELPLPSNARLPTESWPQPGDTGRGAAGGTLPLLHLRLCSAAPNTHACSPFLNSMHHTLQTSHTYFAKVKGLLDGNSLTFALRLNTEISA